MVTKCKRYAEGKVAHMDKDLDVNSNYTDGKFLEMCQKYILGVTLARLGEAHFDTHCVHHPRVERDLGPCQLCGWDVCHDDNVQPVPQLQP